LKALVASGKDKAPLDQFMSSHPIAAAFFSAPNPVPRSFATESFFAVTAFRFINKDGVSCFGRFQILPEGGNQYLEPGDVQNKSSNFLFEEIDERLARGPIKMRVVVEIADKGDDVDNSTVTWPADRRHVEFGTITLTSRVPDDDPEARKIIFDPIPRVDGIDPSNDPLIELRSALYLISGRRRRAAAQHQ
jgi:catalase